MIEKTISRDDVCTLDTLFRKNNIDVNADVGVSVPLLYVYMLRRLVIFHDRMMCNYATKCNTKCQGLLIS